MYTEDGELGKAIAVTESKTGKLIPTFNALPKLVNIVCDLSVGSDIKIINDTTEVISNSFKYNQFKTNKSNYVRNLILGKSVLFEAVLNEETKMVDWIMHDANRYEVVKQGDEILYAKIVGQIFKFNADDEKFESQKATKTYINNEGALTVKTVTEDGEELENNSIVIDRLPLVEMTCSYDMKKLMYCIDSYNQLDSYINNIYLFAGEPILAASGVKAISEEGKNSLKRDRYKTQKVLYSGFDSEVKLLEVKGTSTEQMIKKQKEIIENIIKDFPEYAMSEIVSGSNISTDTVKIRLKEILARVNEIRTSFRNAILDLLQVTAMLEGSTIEGTIELGEVISNDITTTLQNIQQAVTIGIMSKRSAMTLISGLFMDEDVDKEIERINEEGEFNLPALEGITTNSELTESEGGAKGPIVSPIKNFSSELNADIDKTNNAIKE